MRIGLISDIHSNEQALESTLELMTKLRIDKYICLGDLVGYGGSPNVVMDKLCSMVDFTIMGNHDAAVAGQMDYTYYYDAAKEVLEWTRTTLKQEHLDYLENMPYFRVDPDNDICYVHGEPIAPHEFNYVYTLDHAQRLVLDYDKLRFVTFVGHSHLRRIYELSNESAIELPVENMELRPDRKYVIAVGSVGQPRDYDPRACCSVYDTERKAIEFYRINYDIEGAAQKILSEGLPEFFAARLFSGS